MSQYRTYRKWLVENDTRESELTFADWVTASFPHDRALQYQYLTEAPDSGEIRATGDSDFLNEAVLKAEHGDLQAASAALDKARMRRIARLMAHRERLETLLLERIDLKTCSPGHLLKVVHCAISDESKLLEELRSAKKISQEGTKFNADFGDQILGNPDRRDRIRSVLDGLLNAAARIDPSTIGAGSPPSPTGPEDPDDETR